MEDKKQLQNLGPHYQFDQEMGIFKREDYAGIAYSDGDEAERQLEKIIAATTDLTVLSNCLREQCVDWTTTYHLSPLRANILRPFTESLSGSDVLEIGAGCGAITRFLGECGAFVVALEGSIRRAKITRLRTNDLENVSVLAERFSDFQTDKRFDIITLIGVLEYACLYSPAQDPVAEMLGAVRRLLKPGGQLVIAIENQLGLKYFAGSKEDHLGQRMLGIEDRYESGGVRTFGRADLERRVLASGFAETELFLPFPDYKFPVSIISSRGFEFERFDAAALAAQSVKRDPQLPHTPLFAPELVWRQLAKNGIASDLSNSFLLLAKTNIDSPRQQEALAFHYSTARKGIYCKESIFLPKQNGDIVVRSKRLQLKDEVGSEWLSFHPQEEAEYIVGRTLSSEFLDIVNKDGWEVRDVVEFFKLYASIIIELNSNKTDVHSDSTNFDFCVSGTLLDAVPQNLMRKEDGGWYFFDQEWTASEAVPFTYLIFRSIVTLCSHLTVLGRPSDPEIRTWGDFITKLFGELQLPSFNDFKSALISREVDLYEVVSGKFSGKNFVDFLEGNLPVRVDLYGRVEYLTAHLHEINGEVSILRSEVSRLNRVVLDAQRLATKVSKFPFSMYFGVKKKYREIIRQISGA
ncbi:class I SAM-dependent methyltransferase [Agrobacterium sp. 22-209-1]